MAIGALRLSLDSCRAPTHIDTPNTPKAVLNKPFSPQTQRNTTTTPQTHMPIRNIRDIGKKLAKGDIYIGRPGRGVTSIWGNPISRGKTCPECGVIHRAPGSTLSCFEKFARRMAADPSVYRSLADLHGRNLVCFCAPQPCHGDVLLRLAEEFYYELEG